MKENEGKLFQSAFLYTEGEGEEGRVGCFFVVVSD